MHVLDYLTYDAIGLATLVKNREVSIEELFDVSFERLDQVNPKLNAVVRTRRTQAKQEQRDMSSHNAPFSGVPILLKDISQAIKGEPLTNGSQLLLENISQTDSYYTEKIRQAGFQIIGQTNVPEFGLKNTTETKVFGATKNPWQLAHSPGGSSGGAAAAVASGIVPLAGASDGGGSIRIPAGFTGLFGLKPTRGKTPVGPGAGRQWQGAAIDFALSRSVRDSAALLDVLQVVQPSAAFQTPLYNESYLNLKTRQFTKKLKIAYTTASPVRTSVTQEQKQAVLKMVKQLENMGHHVEEKEAPIDGIKLMRQYYTMNAGEMNKVITKIEKHLDRILTPEDMDISTYVLHKAGKDLSAADYSLSLDAWDVASHQMHLFHQDYDLYLTPTNNGGAPKIGELVPTKEQEMALLKVDHYSKQDQIQLIYDMFLPSLSYTPFTQLANLTGQPAMSVPVGLTSVGLPLGCQFMAPKGADDLLIQLAFQLEDSDIWLKKQP